jgi:hypothetical protein
VVAVVAQTYEKIEILSTADVAIGCKAIEGGVVLKNSSLESVIKFIQWGRNLVNS